MGLINYAQGHNDECGSAVIASPFLTSALDKGELSASRPYRTILLETAPSSHSIVSWLHLRANLDVMVLPRMEPSLLVRRANRLVAIPTELSRLNKKLAILLSYRNINI
jgi:hypothetical protein